MRSRMLVVTALTVGSLAAAGWASQAEVVNGSLRVALEGCDEAAATVLGPGGYRLERRVPCGETWVPLFESGTPADGAYQFEVTAIPAGQAEAAAPARVQGGFRVRGGAIQYAQPEPRPGRSPDNVVVNDAQVVIGHQCVGLDCAPGETWDEHDLRIKETDPWLLFQDWSGPGCATRDWRLRANDLCSVGTPQEYFALEDVDAGTRPFQIFGGAPSESLTVNTLGYVGVGTNTPAYELHVSGQEPVLMLHDKSTSNSWLMQARTDRFRLISLTPSVPARQVLAALQTGQIGMGTDAPSTRLHMYTTDGSARLRVEDVSTPAERTLFQLVNNGKTRFSIQNTQANAIWTFDNDGNFTISKVGTGVNEMIVDGDGNLTIRGVLTQGSDRAGKEDVQAVDPAELLERVGQLPLSTWRYTGDGALHVGPMAQDFFHGFGLGADERHLAPGDLAGVGLAAVQALRSLLHEREREIRDLERRLQQLEARLAPAEATP